MTVRQPRYSQEEYARRGTEIYERRIQQQIEEGNSGKVVAIDIETEDYALGTNILTASEPLLTRNADAQIWVIRIGYRAVHQRRVTRKLCPIRLR